MCDEMGGETIDMSSDMAEPVNDIPEDVPEDVSEDIPEDIPEDVPEDIPEDVPEDIPEDVSEDIPEDIPEDVPEDIPEDVPEDIPEDIPEDVPEDIPEDIPEDVSEDIPEDIPEDVSEDIPEDIPEDVSEDIPEDIPEDVSEDIPEDISEEPANDGFSDTSEEIPEDAVEEFIENASKVSDEIPENNEDEAIDRNSAAEKASEEKAEDTSNGDETAEESIDNEATVSEKILEEETLEDTTDASKGTPEDASIPNKSEAELEKSFSDKIKDKVLKPESAYDFERYEYAGIKGAFDEVPRDRREAVYNRFENAPDEVKLIVNENSKYLEVGNTKEHDCCHYNLKDKIIRMEKAMDNDEYSEVFSHEYGHFIDDQKGNVSDSVGFKNAIEIDLDKYTRDEIEGSTNIKNMLDELFSSDAAFDRAVSDNLSAFFRNDSKIVNRYRAEGIPYYQHGDSYWSYPGNRSAEIYANSFSMYAQRNQASCEFMNKYFPNTWNQFKSTL